MKPYVLIVDDDKGHLAMLSTLLKDWGYSIETADDGTGAVEKIKARAYDVVLMDVRMAVMSGIEALQRIQEYNPAIPVLIMTAYSSVASAVEALKAGAYDYLTKPLDTDELKLTLERALDHTRLKTEVKVLKQQLPEDDALAAILGNSPPMNSLKEMIRVVAPTEATVLITGESGTGKELVARAVHALSPRAKGPMVTVNCAALSEALLESELFGHEKGAFTGADKLREGRFMAAHKGSIFLDEIGEISPAVQVKLLRVIQEREIQRVGGEKTLNVDVRILAATNRDLKHEVEQGKFREDLYYRLHVVNVQAPPLRDRVGDVPLLAQRFLEYFSQKNRKQIKGFTPRTMDLLVRATWPGNVRELENTVERAVILAQSDYVSERELPLGMIEEGETQEQAEVMPGIVDTLGGRALEDVEEQAIRETLKKVGGNKSEAARVLGITRATLHKKLKKYGVE